MSPLASSLALGVLGLGSLARAQLQTCGNAQYDPTQYVCWDNEYLCPIIAGEGLSLCGLSCYSTFMYTCSGNVLSLLPSVPASTPFTLSVSNPTLPIDGAPVTASDFEWSINGTTASYCPGEPSITCPAGDVTALAADGSGDAAMNVEVPGGQIVFLGPSWNVGYSQAHSATIPPGSVLGGFGAYQGGGFVNLNGNGWGWVACPPATAGPVWQLVAKNSSNAASLAGCEAVNLRVNTLAPNSVAAWEYN